MQNNGIEAASWPERHWSPHINTMCVDEIEQFQSNKKKWPLNAEKNMNPKVVMVGVPDATKITHAGK